jgi:ankyrin repeat protein
VIERLVNDLRAQGSSFVDLGTGKGETAPWLAASGGHEEAVRLLLDRGAQIDALDREERDPLMAAAMHGHKVVVELLLSRGADASVTDIWAETALALTLKGDQTGVAELLRAHGGVE